MFECKTKQGEATQGEAALLRPDICATQWFPQKRNQFNKIMENVKMLTGGDFDFDGVDFHSRARRAVDWSARLSRPNYAQSDEWAPAHERVSDTSMLMEPIFHQVIRIMGTCFVFRHCAST